MAKKVVLMHLLNEGLIIFRYEEVLDLLLCRTCSRSNV